MIVRCGWMWIASPLWLGGSSWEINGSEEMLAGTLRSSSTSRRGRRRWAAGFVPERAEAGDRRQSQRYQGGVLIVAIPSNQRESQDRETKSQYNRNIFGKAITFIDEFPKVVASDLENANAA
jgi:hypothetical protein